jgi:hypothetical protein
MSHKTPLNTGLLQSALDENGFPIEGSGFGFNVKSYGAAGDGATDDTTAIQSALAAIPSTGGLLYFPAGVYKYSGATLELDKPVTLQGDGGGVHFVDLGPIQGVNGEPAITTIDFASSTGTLFDVQASGCAFKDIGLRNTSVTAPTAGAGIVVSAEGDRTRYENLSVDGFYICIDVQQGSAQTWDGCWIVAPVLYGLKLRNINVPDGGDHFISNCYFYGCHIPAATSAIRIESGGGTKIVNCKIVANSNDALWVNGIDLAVGAGITTVDLLISNCSLEGYSNSGIKATTGAGGFWINHVITGNQFAGAVGCYGIYFDGSSGSIGNIHITGNCGYVSSSINPFIYVANVTGVAISGNAHSGFSNLLDIGASVTWLRSATIPIGGTTGQSLKKLSNANYDVGWA